MFLKQSTLGGCVLGVRTFFFLVSFDARKAVPENSSRQSRIFGLCWGLDWVGKGD